MRIAVVTPFFPNSEQPHRGSATYQLVRRLQSLADISVVCPIPRYPKQFQPRRFDHRPPDLNFKLPDVNVRYIEFPAVPLVTRSINGIVCARYLLGPIRSLSPDLILNYWLYPQGYAAVEVGRKLGIPSVVGSIGTDLNAISSRSARYLTGLTLQRANLIVTKSRCLRERAISLGADPTKVHAVLNGCDRETFCVGDRQTARLELNVDPTKQLIVYVGRFEVTKGLIELLEAFAILHRRGINAQLALIGDGPSRAALIAHARTLGLEQYVRFVPSQAPTGVCRWLAAANLLTLPSYAEGLPSAILEALACGRAVVATRVGGIVEIVDDSCAVLVEPRNSALLADGLEIALNRNWDTSKIANRFRRSWEDMARELFSLCLGVVHDNAAQRQSRPISTSVS